MQAVSAASNHEEPNAGFYLFICSSAQLPHPLQARQLEMERFSLAGSAAGDRAAADRLAALSAQLTGLQGQQKVRECPAGQWGFACSEDEIALRTAWPPWTRSCRACKGCRR